MITLRIPTKHQYAYIEEQYEGNNPKERYEELYALMNSNQQFNEIDFNQKVVDLVNSDLTKWGDVETYNQFTDSQKAVYQALKRFLKRLPQE